MTSTEQPDSPRIGPSQPSIRRLAMKITGSDADPTNLRRRWATVVAVNADLTVDISLDGITLPSVKRVATYIPVVGDTVTLDVNGTDIVVAGATVTPANDLSNVPPAIQANAQSITSVNAVVTGHTTQLATHTSEISTNTTAVTGLQDKVNGGTVKFSSQSVAASGLTVGKSGVTVNVGGAGGGLTQIGSDPVGNPGLVFPNNNAAVLAGSAGVYITNANNSARAPITAAGATFDSVTASGGAYFASTVTASNIIAGNGADFGGGGVHGGTFTTAVVNNSGKVTTYDLTATDNIAGGGLFASVGVWSPAYNPPASRRDKKTNVRSLSEYLGRSASEVVGDLDVCAWQYDPEKTPTYADGIDRVSFMVDDLEQAAPQLVVPHDPAHAEAESGSPDTDDTYNTITMLNLALAAIKEQGQEISALKARVAALETMNGPIA